MTQPMPDQWNNCATQQTMRRMFDANWQSSCYQRAEQGPFTPWEPNNLNLMPNRASASCSLPISEMLGCTKEEYARESLIVREIRRVGRQVTFSHDAGTITRNGPGPILKE